MTTPEVSGSPDDTTLRPMIVELKPAQLDAVDALLHRAERPDLIDRFRSARARRVTRTCRLLVVGEFKKGKSTLVNALVNAAVSPVDDQLATALPLEVHHGEQIAATVLVHNLDTTQSTDSRTIRIEELPHYLLEGGRPEEAAIAVRIELPRQLLASRLVIVDTPGVGGLSSAHGAATIGLLPSADAVVFVTDASQELTAAEVGFLRTIQSMCPTVLVVVTKTDFYPQWRRIVDLNRNHLARNDLNVRLLPLSSTLRATAIERNDRAMNDESGYSELVSYLRDELISDVQAQAEAHLHHEVVNILGELQHQLESEARVLDDPAHAADLVRELEAARHRSEQLRSQAARWQTALADGNADLVSDVEHDLRLRIRESVRQAEAAIEAMEPAKSWDNFEPWLCARIATDVVYNFQLLQHRAERLTIEVATLFGLDHDQAIPPGLRTVPKIFAADSMPHPVLHLDQPTPISQALSALRGTSGGMIMFTAFMGIAKGESGSGISKFLASNTGKTVSVAAGLMLGGKTLIDERKRQMQFRRGQAKQAVRRYSDETMFAVSKDSKDSLRRMHRQLRDHFLRVAEELTASANESLIRAKQTTESSVTSRKQRRQQLQLLMDSVAAIGRPLGL